MGKAAIQCLPTTKGCVCHSPTALSGIKLSVSAHFLASRITDCIFTAHNTLPPTLWSERKMNAIPKLVRPSLPSQRFHWIFYTIVSSLLIFCTTTLAFPTVKWHWLIATVRPIIVGASMSSVLLSPILTYCWALSFSTVPYRKMILPVSFRCWLWSSIVASESSTRYR